MNQKLSRNTVECQLLYKLGEHYCIVQLSLLHLTSFTVTLVSLQTLHWPVCAEMKGAFWMLHILNFSLCSMARDIVWPFCMFLYKRELSYLTENRYMKVDSLPVEPACVSFFFFLKLYLPLFKKKRKKPPFRNHLSFWELYHCKLESHLIKLFTFFSSEIQLI